MTSSGDIWIKMTTMGFLREAQVSIVAAQARLLFNLSILHRLPQQAFSLRVAV